MRHLALVDGYITVNLGRAIPIVTTIPLAAWDCELDVLHAPFGYLPPSFEENDHDIISVRVCPELIADQVDHLDDEEDVLEYLREVEQHICLHVIHFKREPADQLEQFITQLIRDTAPACAARAEDIQMRALGASTWQS